MPTTEDRTPRRFLASKPAVAGAGALMFLAALLIALRLCFPLIEGYRAEAQAWISQQIGVTVSIGTLKAGWDGWTPELQLEDVRLHGSGDALIARFGHTRITVDPLLSLLAGKPRLGEMTVTGARLTLVRGPNNAFSIDIPPEEAHNSASGNSAPAAVQHNDNALLLWLSSQGRLRLRSAHIVWNDRRTGRGPYEFSDVNVRVRNDGSRHRLDGTLSLADAAHGRLSFAMDLRGDLAASRWSGTVFVGGKNLDIARWPWPLEESPVHIDQGLVAFRAWGTWRFGELNGLEGELGLRELSLSSSARALRIEEAEGRFVASRTPDGWFVDANRIQLTTSNGPWPDSGTAISVQTRGPAQTRSVALKASYLRLQDLIALFPAHQLPEGILRNLLIGAETRAELHGLDLHWSAAGTHQDLRLQTGFRGLGIRAYGPLPALSGLAGRLEADNNGGNLILNTQELQGFVPVMRTPSLPATRARGRLAWQRTAGGWRLETRGVELVNADFSGRVMGRADWTTQAHESPLLALVMELDETNLVSLRNYLPVHVLPTKAANWIERAMENGRLKSGKIVLRGNLEDFPFDQQNGKFEVRAELADMALQYARNWPRLTELHSHLVLQGRQLKVTTDAGNVVGARIEDGVSSIPDVLNKAPVLEVNSHFSGATSQVLEFLEQSPLAQKLGKALNGLSVQGDTRVALHVHVPLTGGPKAVQGTVKVNKNTLEIAPLGLQLEALNGQFDFVGTRIRARGIKARFIGEPVLVDVDSGDPSGGRLSLSGTATKEVLARKLARIRRAFGKTDDTTSALLEHIRGQSPWRATVRIPPAWGARGGVPRLSIESPLTGLAVNLPRPLRKSADEQRNLAIETALAPGDERVYRIRLGDDLNGVLAFQVGPDGYEFRRGSIRAGSDMAQMPESDGLFIGGSTAELSVDEWARLARGPEDAPQKTGPVNDPEAKNPILRAIRQVDLEISRLEILRHWFDAIHLNIEQRSEDSWTAQASGNALQGRMQLPDKSIQGPVIIELDRLMLGARERPEEDVIHDPRLIPPIRFSCKEFVVKSRPIGSVKLVTAPHPEGLRIENLYIHGDTYESHARGFWLYKDGEHKSQFEAEVNGDDLGVLLNGFGYEGSVTQGGAAAFLIDAAWPGPPSRFAVKDLTGLLHFRSTNGRLLDLSPGATGRVFGLLSVTALPRRLLLDFDDLFKRGLAYELMEGSFSIENGDAYTNNFFMDSRTATIEVTGRAGLVDQDYDQTITVIPKVSSNVLFTPIWLAEKLFKKRILDKAFKYQYTVTGSWQKPVVELVKPQGFPNESG